MQSSLSAVYSPTDWESISLSYTDFLYNEGTNIFNAPAKCNFDIIVNMNSVMPEEREQGLSKVLSSKFISLEIVAGTQELKMLKELLEKVMEQFAHNENCQLLLKLADIYDQCHMVNILYAYTFVLLEKMDKTADEGFNSRCHKALDAVENEIGNCQKSSCSSSGRCFIEYALFAKYECQRKINELCLLRGRSLEFDVEDYLENIDEIYEVDADFYKVEYLKARVAEQDSRYSVYAKFFLENCIKECKVDVCRSYHYYGLAKWKERNRQPYEAEQYYRLSWEKDPAYIKAVFKLAVENAKSGRRNLAENFLQNIIAMWTDQDDKGLMAPMEIEYAYKVRRWMYILEKDLSWCTRAESFLEFVCSLKKMENVKDYYFMKRMYSEQKELGRICDAMSNRINVKCIA